MDYEQLKIKSYKHWELYLHENQCYIGRVFVLLKDDTNVDDFLAIGGDVRDEFFYIGQEVKSALKRQREQGVANCSQMQKMRS